MARKPDLIAFVIVFILASAAAKADVVFTLDQNGCSTGCWVDPMGTVALHQKAPDVVTVTLSLVPDYSLREAPDRNHHTLVFNTPNHPLLVASNLVTDSGTGVGWTLLGGPAPFKDAPFGDFSESLQCTKCEPHTNHLVFDLTSAGLTTSSFVGNTGGYYFAADVVGLTGRAGRGLTGNVASKGPGVPVPDGGATFLLLGGALFGLAPLRRRFGV